MSGPLLGIPWYVHPLEDPHAWQWLASPDPRPGFIVINVHNGPGHEPDPCYQNALTGIAGNNLLGYVDLDYGHRSRRAVASDVRRWVSWYGITGVMFDRVPSSRIVLPTCQELVSDARKAGITAAVGNPGTVPSPEYVELFDTTCVFEDSWTAYQKTDFPDWLRDVPSQKLWHLVYSCPPKQVGCAMERAAQSGAGYAFATPGELPNPWLGLTGKVSTAGQSD